MYWNREKVKKYIKTTFLMGGILLFIGGIFVLYRSTSLSPTLDSYTESLGDQGKEIKDSFSEVSAMPLTEEDKAYVFQDVKGGIDIQYAGQENKQENGIKVSLPKNYTDPIEVKLDEQRVISIKDNTTDTYSAELLEANTTEEKNATELQKLLNFATEEGSKNYLKYENERKSLLYAYQKDAATGERKMKHWTVYSQGTEEEKESYTIEGATIRKNDNGDINVYYQSEQDIKNEAVAKEVPADLMERAQRTLEKEMGADPNRAPDFVIPKPYYLNKDSRRQDLEWTIDEAKKQISLEFKVSTDQYPIALDPTLQFQLPGVISGGDVIGGDEANNHFGNGMAAGDMNNDGKMDLIVGDNDAGDGRAYIFYNDGDYAPSGANADIIINGSGSSVYFATRLITGDFNTDGKTDLVVSDGDFIGVGNVYIFYNDGSIPTTAATADVTIAGDVSYSGFGNNLSSGDLNADGRIDLVIGTYDYDGTLTGAAYIYYNDGSYPTTAATADVRITGQTGGNSNNFSYAFAIGDFNTDGKIDLAAGDPSYSTFSGRTYIFYNDGSYPASAASADVIINGNTDESFGSALDAGDFNADGRIDLAAISSSYPAGAGPGGVFIYYNDGSYPTTTATADVIIDGSATYGLNYQSLVTGDFNNDKRTDIAVASGYNGSDSYVYVLYNDGTYPSSIDTADVIVKGESDGDSIGAFFASGDFNNDGTNDLAFSSLNTVYYGIGHVYLLYSQDGLLNTNKKILAGATDVAFGTTVTATDLNSDGKKDIVVSDPSYSTSTGRAYIFYNDGTYPGTSGSADITITGAATGDNFGRRLAVGDFNFDGKTDLAIGAYGHSSSTGRAYIFYNDGSIPTTAGTADVTITGGATGDNFGRRLAVGDFNFDGRVDLAVGARAYSSSTGRAYIFYNDGSIPTTAGTADVTITGGATGDLFGDLMEAGDFNADGRVDLAVGARGYSSSTGRVYIFNNDGSIPTTTGTADVTITGENTGDSFGDFLTSGDVNADGKIDLVVGAFAYSTNTGRAYIFYNDGSIPTTAGTADVILTGEGTGNFFGNSLYTEDFNADGRTDLVVGAYGYNSSTGRAYVFYNDGSIPTTAATADVILTGTTSGDLFGQFLYAGDFDSDGKTDLVVGAPGHTVAGTGAIFFYNGEDSYSWTLQEQPLGSSRIQPNVTGEELKITGAASLDYLGLTLTSGDMNSDGKTDLIAGTGDKVYIFYNDGNYSSGASSADVIITGQGGNFSAAFTTGDFNADGTTDLAVGDTTYSSFDGRAYIFYNDGSIPTTAATADVIISGETSSGLGGALVSGDLNADGKTDLIVGSNGDGTFVNGRAYIFYNDGSIPTTAATADVLITGGETTNDYFSDTLAVGDFNTDGRTDLIAGASNYSSGTGRSYIFYNDGSIPTTSATADVIITGNAASDNFGVSLISGDLNFDGKLDIVVGASGYSSGTGRAYIFYNDGSIPTTAATADVTITGNATGNAFGFSLATGDLNSDGRTDLTVGANAYSTNTGRAYIFYNDGSIPTTAATADVTLTGESTGNYYGQSLLSGDFNADGRHDLIIGAYRYGSDRGRVYMYTFNDKVIAGSGSEYFGSSLIAGDFNADGKVDLAAGAPYATNGKVYIFYNGLSAIAASSADITITGETSGDLFGVSLVAGDFNSDGEADLAVGATGADNTYIFYNDGSIPATATTADVAITGAGGSSLATGDLNADGRVDLVVGGCIDVCIFYNDGSIPTTGATADVIITGSDGFGLNLATGDLNADGETDLVVGAYGYSSNTGRAYIFYNDGSIPTTAATADVIITGEGGEFGGFLSTGDLNADGKTDLVVGAPFHVSQQGRAYIFYNDGSIPTTAATADVAITGVSGSQAFGGGFAVGDLNADGRQDLAVEAFWYPGGNANGRIYIFYNDGNYPSTATSYDKVYDGAGASDNFGNAGDIQHGGIPPLVVVDWNNDSISDLLVGAPGYTNYNYDGAVYVFISEIVATAVDTIAGELKGGSATMKGSFELK